MRRAAMLAAIIFSAIGVGMSSVAAIDRSVGNDRALMIAANVGVTLAAHTLLVFTRRPAALVIWAVCLSAVVYGHVTFVAGAMARSGQQRATAVPPTAEQAALTQQLNSITARPTATVAAALANALRTSAQADRMLATCTTSTPGRCATSRAVVTSSAARADALRIELTSAQQADALRARLSTAASDTDQRRITASADPAAAALSTLTGLPAAHLQSASALVTAVLIELIAVLLWQVAIPTHRHDDTRSTPSTSPAHHALDTASHAQHHPRSEPPSAHHWPAHAERRVPSDTARSRPADRLRRARSGRDAVESLPASRPRPTGADGRQREGLPAQAGLPGDGMGRARPRAVDTG